MSLYYYYYIRRAALHAANCVAFRAAACVATMPQTLCTAAFACAVGRVANCAAARAAGRVAFGARNGSVSAATATAAALTGAFSLQAATGSGAGAAHASATRAVTPLQGRRYCRSFGRRRSVVGARLRAVLLRAVVRSSVVGRRCSLPLARLPSSFFLPYSRPPSSVLACAPSSLTFSFLTPARRRWCSLARLPPSLPPPSVAPSAAAFSLRHRPLPSATAAPAPLPVAA